MGENLSTIRGIVRQILRDELVSFSEDYEWEDGEIDDHIAECLREVSRLSPRKVIEVLTTTQYSKMLDISAITDLLYIEKLEYPTGNDPRDFRNFAEIDEDTIEIDVDATPDAGGSGTLTGTVTFASGSSAVTGSGTDFDGELAAGYHIRPSGGTRWYKIYSITSDTALTLAEPCRSGDAGADTINLTEYCYETVYLYCAKAHTLTDATSTLNLQQEEALITGVCAKATLSKARSHIDAVNEGGANVASSMMAWGTTQYGLYQSKLGQIVIPRTKRRYPKD